MAWVFFAFLSDDEQTYEYMTHIIKFKAERRRQEKQFMSGEVYLNEMLHL